MPKRRRHKCNQLYPEPGTWITDVVSGMPPIQPPPDLPRDRKLSAGEVRDDYVAYEGLGYCIYTYIPHQKIADAKLVKLWQRARAAMQDIVEYLETVPAPPSSLPAPRRGPKRKPGQSRKSKSKRRLQVEVENVEPLSLSSLGDDVTTDF